MTQLFHKAELYANHTAAIHLSQQENAINTSLRSMLLHCRLTVLWKSSTIPRVTTSDLVTSGSPTDKKVLSIQGISLTVWDAYKVIRSRRVPCCLVWVIPSFYSLADDLSLFGILVNSTDAQRLYLTHEHFFLRLKSMVAVRYLRHTGPIETYYNLNRNSPQRKPCTFRAMRRVEDCGKPVEYDSFAEKTDLLAPNLDQPQTY